MLPDGRRREHQCKTKREAQEWLNERLRVMQRVLPTTFHRYQKFVCQHCVLP